MAKKVKFDVTDIISNPDDVFNLKDIEDDDIKEKEDFTDEEEDRDDDKVDKGTEGSKGNKVIDNEEEDDQEEDEEEEEEEVDDETDDEDDEGEEDEEDEEEEEVDFDADKAKIVYDILSDFIDLPDIGDEITEEKLSEVLEDLPIRMLQEVAAAKGSFFEDLLLWLVSEDNPTPESLKEFYEKFVDQDTIDIEEFDDPEAARKFLASTPEMKKLHKSEEKRLAALDVLDDDEVIERANELVNEKRKEIEQKRKQALEEKKRQQAEIRKKQKEYWNAVKATINNLDWSETRKAKVVENIKPDVINQKWQAITQKPEHLVQFADILAYYNPDSGFDDLYKTLDRKSKASSNSKTSNNLKQSKLSTYLKTKKRKSKEKGTNILDFIE